MSAQIFNFKRQPLREEEKLTIKRGQQEMLLQYIEGCMLRAEDGHTADQFSNIHNMLWVFCQPMEES